VADEVDLDKAGSSLVPLASTMTSGSGPAISRLSSRTVECVTPAASRRTITERRPCRSMPTYCRSTGVPLRRGWVGWETPSVATLDPSRRSETPTFRATIDHSGGWRPCAPYWRPSRESGESLLHHINALGHLVVHR
jgi:hypothetical protein